MFNDLIICGGCHLQFLLKNIYEFIRHKNDCSNVFLLSEPPSSPLKVNPLDPPEDLSKTRTPLHYDISSILGLTEDACPKEQTPKTTPKKSFLCKWCNLNFNQKIHLQKHEYKHTGEKPYKCIDCDYSTVERSHLRVHTRIHTGEKPFKCTSCSYATTQRGTLKVHLRNRHGAAIYECHKCALKFFFNYQLSTHLQKH